MKKFIVWIAEDLDKNEIEAYSASGAAESFVEMLESNRVEFPVGNGTDTINITVRDESEEVFHFVVSGQPRPEYSAEEVEGFD